MLFEEYKCVREDFELQINNQELLDRFASIIFLLILLCSIGTSWIYFIFSHIFLLSASRKFLNFSSAFMELGMN